MRFLHLLYFFFDLSHDLLYGFWYLYLCTIQRWVDPFFDLEQFHTKPPVEDELTIEAESDEEQRRIASEKVLSSMMPKWIEKEVADCKLCWLLYSALCLFICSLDWPSCLGHIEHCIKNRNKIQVHIFWITQNCFSFMSTDLKTIFYIYL